jgi:hypothetical protein
VYPNGLVTFSLHAPLLTHGRFRQAPVPNATNKSNYYLFNDNYLTIMMHSMPACSLFKNIFSIIISALTAKVSLSVRVSKLAQLMALHKQCL